MNGIAHRQQFADKAFGTWGRVQMDEEQRVVRRSLIERWFPERQVYLRSNGDTRGYVLTSGRQMTMAGVACAAAAWTLVASGGFVFDMIARSQADTQVVRARAASERLNADLQARLETAVVRMSATTGGLDEMARMVERRHAALTNVMGMFHGVDGAEAALAPAPALGATEARPVQRIVAVRMDQERLIERAGDFAQTRAERLRLAFRLAGLNPAAYGAASGSALGGPLVEASDPKALATILDVDEPFAVRIRHAADNLSEMRNLSDAAEHLPFDRPTEARTTSGFGVRFDPFNGRPAVHQGDRALRLHDLQSGCLLRQDRPAWTGARRARRGASPRSPPARVEPGRPRSCVAARRPRFPGVGCGRRRRIGGGGARNYVSRRLA